jgi:hypothetical protein
MGEAHVDQNPQTLIQKGDFPNEEPQLHNFSCNLLQTQRPFKPSYCEDFGSDRPGEERGMVRGKRTLVDGGVCKSSAVKSKLKKIALVGKEDKQKDYIQGKEL